MGYTDPYGIQVTYSLADIEGRACKEDKQLRLSRLAVINTSEKITKTIKTSGKSVIY